MQELKILGPSIPVTRAKLNPYYNVARCGKSYLKEMLSKYGISMTIGILLRTCVNDPDWGLVDALNI